MEYVFFVPALILAALLIGMLGVGAIFCISRRCCEEFICITKLLRRRHEGLSTSQRDDVAGHTA
jgi:hypothetical protein